MHVDQHLAALSAEYGAWIYALMFFVVFAETGFVIATILPSDTVLFAAGALAAQGRFSISLLFFGFFAAAFLGDALNFAVGRVLGAQFFSKRRVPFVSREALDKAHAYYAKNGGAAVVGSRFIPVLRSLAPLVGGVARMEPRRFLFFNAVGKLAWTPLYVFGGYFFGTVPWVRERFTVVILAAVGVPFLIALVRMSVLWLRASRRVDKAGRLGKGS